MFLDDCVGITSTVPVEILFAAGKIPMDLNNRFIATADPQNLVEAAERDGLPRSACAWVKGIYAAIRRSRLRTVVGVVQGDCAHLQAMLESLIPEGVTFVPFAYPYDKNRYLLRFAIENLMQTFGVQWDQVRAAKRRLDRVRALAHELDRRTWHDGNIGGEENFEALVNCTDFKGDPELYGEELETALAGSRDQLPKPSLRLGLLGVPTVFTDLFAFLEEHGARVVFNEVARQFAMPVYSEELLEQYMAYTFPYSVFARVEDIRAEARRRRLHGFIHYVQAFCHHQLEDGLFRRHLDLPLLTLEGDRPGPLDARTRTRLEAFMEMLFARRTPAGKSGEA